MQCYLVSESTINVCNFSSLNFLLSLDYIKFFFKKNKIENVFLQLFLLLKDRVLLKSLTVARLTVFKYKVLISTLKKKRVLYSTVLLT